MNKQTNKQQQTSAQLNITDTYIVRGTTCICTSLFYLLEEVKKIHITRISK